MNPLGFEAAKAEWDDFELKCHSPRPYTLDLWNELTLGQQARYGAMECKTKGAIYSSVIKKNEVTMSIALPDNLIMHGLTEKEAKWLENALHKKFEETIHWIVTSRNNGWGLD